MTKNLREYLGVLPFDYAQSRQFNVYDWARRKIVSNYLEDVDPGLPPRFFLDGKPVKNEDINYYLKMCKDEVDKIIER
jgi:hypothetical protein